MKLYVVRNKQGKFFRSVKHAWCGGSWVDGLDEAKFYAKIGQAKGRVTYLHKDDPSYGCSDILEFDLDPAQAKILDMQGETDKKIKRANEKALKQEISRREWEKERLTKQQEEIKLKLSKL